MYAKTLRNLTFAKIGGFLDFEKHRKNPFQYEKKNEITFSFLFDLEKEKKALKRWKANTKTLLLSLEIYLQNTKKAEALSLKRNIQRKHR